MSAGYNVGRSRFHLLDAPAMLFFPRLHGGFFFCAQQHVCVGSSPSAHPRHSFGPSIAGVPAAVPDGNAIDPGVTVKSHFPENRERCLSPPPLPPPLFFVFLLNIITVVLGRVVVASQVYKENLVETILPSIQSVMTAVLHYKKMGGEANLYINDDGLQVRLAACL